MYKVYNDILVLNLNNITIGLLYTIYKKDHDVIKRSERETNDVTNGFPNLFVLHFTETLCSGCICPVYWTKKGFSLDFSLFYLPRKRSILS